MKVLLNDNLASEGIRVFEELGIETDTKKRDLEALIKDIGEFDALIVRSGTKVNREVLEAGARGKLKIVGRAGVGYDNIDVGAASENGIVVKCAPYGNTNAVAELTLCLMLNISRNVPQAYHALKEGKWRKTEFKGTELSFKTLGILGCGKIGQRLGELARRGFDMEVIGYDICPCAESTLKYVSKQEVLLKADYVSIHTGGRATIVGKKELSMMKPTSYLINTSRGSNVDEKALYEALKEGRIAGAALDVYAEEPKAEGAKFNNKLRKLENVIFSSHLGALTIEAQRDTSVEIARVIAKYLLGGDFTNSVNAGESIEFEEKPIYTLFIHHRDVPGVFAYIDKILADNDINIRANYSRQIGKSGFAISVYVLHKKVPPKIIQTLKNFDNICHVKV
jgi:D-3-phosphoglycerate dehydrogenase